MVIVCARFHKVIGFEPDPKNMSPFEGLSAAAITHAVWERPVRPFIFANGNLLFEYPPAEESNRAYKSAHWTGRVR